jgi:hypothetical protein
LPNIIILYPVALAIKREGSDNGKWRHPAKPLTYVPVLSQRGSLMTGGHKIFERSEI